MTSAPFHIYSLEDKFSEKRSKNHIKKNVLIHKMAMKQDMILLTVVLFKNGHALVELGVLVILDEGGADTQAFLMAAGGDETDGRNTVVHKLLGQLAAGHILIADGEVETVGYRLVKVAVVDDVETVAEENLLELVGAVAVDFHLVAEVVLTVAGGTEHGGQGILGRVAGA